MRSYIHMYHIVDMLEESSRHSNIAEAAEAATNPYAFSKMQSAAPNGAEAKQAKQQAMPDSAGVPSVSAKIRNGSAASAASPAQVSAETSYLSRPYLHAQSSQA